MCGKKVVITLEWEGNFGGNEINKAFGRGKFMLNMYVGKLMLKVFCAKRVEYMCIEIYLLL